VPALPVGFSSAGNGPAGNGHSRITDTAPVVESRWDRTQSEDEVLVPSRATAGPVGTPRRAELEVVAGRPVWVFYRPSHGLVVGDQGDDAPRPATG
jgi:hypothetical protein